MRGPATAADQREITPVGGKDEVDHGETGSKTPDAASYIAKTVEYRKKKSKTKKR